MIPAIFGGAVVRFTPLVAAARSFLANRQAIPCPGIEMVRIIGLAVKHFPPAFDEFLLIDELVPLLTCGSVCATGHAFEVNDHGKRLVVNLQASLANSETVVGLL